MFDVKQFNEVSPSYIRYAEFMGAIDGSSYFVEFDQEDDVTKMSHYVKTDIDGRVYAIKQSPYQLLTIREVSDIGFAAIQLAEYDNFIAQA